MRAVPAGVRVEAGAVLAEFRNAELEQQLAAAQGIRTQRLATVRALENRRFSEPSAAAALPAAAESLKAADERLQTLQQALSELTLRSPRAGLVLLPRQVPRLPDDGDYQTWSGYIQDAATTGAWVEPQTLVCWVGEPADLRLTALAEQSDVDRLRSDSAEACVVLLARADRRLSAVVERVGTAPVTAIDRELISAGLI
ncbi:MAG: hypothetical protein ACKPHU_33140, partial [Planctomycetaceae bacterium]